MDERREGNGRRDADQIRSEVGHLDKRVEVLEQRTGRILDLLDGPELRALDGSEFRDRKLGMDYRLQQIESNGVKAKLPPVVTAAIITGAVSLVGTFVVLVTNGQLG